MVDLNSIVDLVKPKVSKYCPHQPFGKQMAFMMLRNTEALYGGALGGGKSDALLMDAMQFVHIPGYSALILRRTLQDLQLPSALLTRMTTWMIPYTSSKEVKYEASKHRFVFPTFDTEGNSCEPAVVQFGYIGDSNAYTRYQGAELQYVWY